MASSDDAANPGTTPNAIPATPPGGAPSNTYTPAAAAAPNGSLGVPFDPNKVPAPGEAVNYPPAGGATAAGWNPSTMAPNQEYDRYSNYDKFRDKVPNPAVTDPGRYLSPAGAPLDQRALPPYYNADMAEAMGLPKDAPLPPPDYNVYKPTTGIPAQTSDVAPAYAKPGGATQVYTGSGPPEDQKGDGVSNLVANGQLQWQYGVSTGVADMSPEEQAEVQRAEAAQAH
jgi:Tuberculosis necrotizing toxin